MLYSVVLALMAGGCNEYTPQAIGSSADEPIDERGPQISVDPLMVDFGTLSSLEGQQGQRLVTVTNLGDENLTITGLSLEDVLFTASPFTLGSIGATVLEPGGSTEVPVGFAPSTFDPAIATIRIDSDDPQSPTVVVDVNGNAAAPVIAVDPEVYDFGNVPVGCDGELQVTVSNVGQETLVVDEVALVAASESMDVIVQGLPWTVAPSASETFDVSYVPPNDTSDSAMVRLASNDPTRPEVLASLSGSPLPLVSQMDHFIQGGLWDKVDIMLTLSEYFTCPSSMEDELHELMDAAGAILDGLNASGLDYQIMVNTNLDGCHNGAIVTNTTPDQVNALQNAIYGHSLSPDTLEVARSGLSRTGAGDCNEGFVREDSLVKVIAIADSDDLSPGSVEDYVDQMNILAPGIIYSTVSGPPPDACSPDAFAAPRLLDAATMMFGVQENICDANWTDHVVDIVMDFAGGVAAPESGSFTLTDSPIVDTIEVQVDGVVVSNWAYDASVNAVVFDDGTWPQKLSTIDVSYDLASDCDQ